jgi:hypothetical protein
VQTFCTASRRPAGPLAPPTRRTASAPAGAPTAAATNAGRLAQNQKSQAVMTYSSHGSFDRGTMRLLPLSRLSGSGQNPSRAPAASAAPIFDS